MILNCIKEDDQTEKASGKEQQLFNSEGRAKRKDSAEDLGQNIVEDTQIEWSYIHSNGLDTFDGVEVEVNDFYLSISKDRAHGENVEVDSAEEKEVLLHEKIERAHGNMNEVDETNDGVEVDINEFSTLIAAQTDTETNGMETRKKRRLIWSTAPIASSTNGMNLVGSFDFTPSKEVGMADFISATTNKPWFEVKETIDSDVQLHRAVDDVEYDDVVEEESEGSSLYDRLRMFLHTDPQTAPPPIIFVMEGDSLDNDSSHQAMNNAKATSNNVQAEAAGYLAAYKAKEAIGHGVKIIQTLTSELQGRVANGKANNSLESERAT